MHYVHKVQSRSDTSKRILLAVRNQQCVLMHGASGCGGTGFLLDLCALAATSAKPEQQVTLSYHNATGAYQHSIPIPNDILKSDAVLLDDFSRCTQPSSRYNTYGLTVVGFTPVESSDDALFHWYTALDHPAPDLTIRILGNGMFCVSEEVCHV